MVNSPTISSRMSSSVDDTLNVAVFVDHERDAAFLLLKIEQLRVQRRAFRHEIRFARQVQQFGFGERILLNEPHGAPQVQHADDVVDVLFVTPAGACVGSVEICDDDVGDRAVDVDANDFTAGHHDVVDRDGFEIDDAQQHVLASFGNPRAFVQHRAKFVHVQMIFARKMVAAQKWPQYEVADAVDEPRRTDTTASVAAPAR